MASPFSQEVGTWTTDPIWAAYGKWIHFFATAQGVNGIYRRRADGTGSAERLYGSQAPMEPETVSPDGKWLLYFTPSPDLPHADLWSLPLDSNGRGAPEPVLWQKHAVVAKFSPDGKWVAYDSTESGRPEIYVAPFPGPGPKRRISTAGGRYARWRSEGKEIFCAREDQTLVATEVSIKNGEVQVGVTRSLGIPIVFSRSYTYEVTSDGKRFLVAVPREEASAPLTVVQNWTSLLKTK